MNECISGLRNQSKALFGAVVVKYLEICETCGTNVHIYDVWLQTKTSVFFIFLS